MICCVRERAIQRDGSHSYDNDGKGVPKFCVSDRVRISKYKAKFEKGYMANCNEEIFTIHEVHPSDPPVYRLFDDLSDVVDGSFYEPELQKVGYQPVKCTAWNRYCSVAR